ncbi:hypothetical protein TSUD_322950 [Trifolium subterraneum]|uniref:Uncharacterized protein n=1 Tax=Trifolium subterraneum TaxID=3900 RepID=A0A2Z6N654_TRISU|nr:hypothetical protein TSUD_322950 [Trifolium subterraneum]
MSGTQNHGTVTLQNAEAKVPDYFKSPHLPTFDGKTGPLEHLMAVGTQTAIIGGPEHLRCKLLSGTFKDAALRWYMNLPKNSIENYVDFHKKFIHQFSRTKHIKVTATSLFTIRQNNAETLREYLAKFSEATIKVSNPNQEMFVTAFHNGLKAGHFNESLTKKTCFFNARSDIRASCYIKGKERNAEKRSRDAKEKDAKGQRQGYRSKPYYPANGNGGMAYPQHRRFSTFTSPQDEERHHGPRYRSIVRLPPMQRSQHRKFLEDVAKGQIALSRQEQYPPKGEGDKGSKSEKNRVAVNTIAVGFAGGGESNSAKKHYVRHSMFEVCSVGHTTFPRVPEISFSAEDGRDVMPHDDDPLVVQVQILNCDVKRVLIDSGSSADILYWEAFEAMQLSDEQLKPYSETLVGFAGEQVEVMDQVTLYTTFGMEENVKTIKVRYLVVKTPFTSYNIIIERPAFNSLGAIMSTLYLAMKYPLDNGKVGVVKGDQALARKIHQTSILEKKESRRRAKSRDNGGSGKAKGSKVHRRDQVPYLVSKHGDGEEANDKWRMCVDFTDLNKACAKDPYPLPNIDKLIDGASRYKTLSFIDACSGYNQIQMNPMDTPRTAFMSNTCNYFYNVVPFGLNQQPDAIVGTNCIFKPSNIVS